MMRKRTEYIIIHCSATPPTLDIGKEEIDKWHRQRGWFGIGYHFVIRRNGTVEIGRPVMEVGAHAQGYNAVSVGVCLIGGVDSSGQTKPQNNFTPQQWESLLHLLKTLKTQFPGAKIIGHSEVSNKACPSFDVQKWKATVGL